MQKMAKRYHDFISREMLFNRNHRLLIAGSGGLDSSVLLHLTITAGYVVEIAHCNFGLRGEESDRDEAFVRELASQYQVPFHVRHFDTGAYASHHRVSIQEAAREMRYQWFDQLTEERGLHRILTAHHADDNVETVMMNVFKGTGMAGLRGMLPLSGKIARPLLFASREELEAYAAQHGIAYVADSSNLTDKYTRNYFRLHVIPLIEQVYPGTSGNLRNSLPRFREAEMLYRASLESKFKKLIFKVGEDLHIPVEKLRRSEPLHTIVFELFHPYGFKPGQTDEIIGLMDSETGRYMLSSTHRLLKNRNWFVISKLHDVATSILTIDTDATEVEVREGRLVIGQPGAVQSLENDPNVACMDAREVVFPLILRKWKAGDYFYPLGMRKKKKISRFFIDHKLSLAQKERIWVLESDKRIIWVVGMRIDDRVKLKPSTTDSIKCTWIPDVE
jgi:tRNA(Ile)-lysidine synthase